MYVSDSLITNLLILYSFNSISILICDLWHRSRADIDLVPSYMRDLSFGKIVLALILGPLMLFMQFAGNISRRSGQALTSSWEVYYTVAFYGLCLYEPKWSYFIAATAAHFIVRRIARYTRD
jgi:hypothetical protein